MKQPVRIFSHGDCYADSYMNGGAYELGITGAGSVFLQGDDATAWREACKVDLVTRYSEVMQ